MNGSRRDFLRFRFGGPPSPAVAIDTRACIAWNRGFCSTCVERCPTPGAIRVIAQLPQINLARCDGCGVCVPLCPAPTPAISVP